MDKKEFLYQLLYKAFLVIREEAYYIENEKIFKVSNFCHNLPLRLKKCETEQDFENLFNECKRIAELDGITKWL